MACGQRPNVAHQCSLLPPCLPLSPIHSKNSDISQPGPFILYSGGIKITTKTLQKSLKELIGPSPPQPPELPSRKRKSGERKEGDPGSVGISKDPAGKLGCKGVRGGLEAEAFSKLHPSQVVNPPRGNDPGPMRGKGCSLVSDSRTTLPPKPSPGSSARVLRKAVSPSCAYKCGVAWAN